MKSASKTVLMYCAFMRETSVRSRVLVGPSLFCEELKDKRDRINFVSVSKGENFLSEEKKRKRATTFESSRGTLFSLLASSFSERFLLRMMIVYFMMTLDWNRG
jgi:hypothetical protein